MEELASIESRDSGKTITMASKIDIPRAVSNFRFFAGQLRHDQTGCHMMSNALNYTRREPVGVFALITPWNLPLYLLTWKVAPALAMGNCVVAKPSELTPMTASALAEIIAPLVPPGVFNLVHGLGARVGAPLVAHPDTQGISFTGGTVTGEKVAASAAPMFKKMSLELGGKNSTIVFQDADISKAVVGALRAAFTNQGQVCLAGSRLFVQRSIYSSFMQDFLARARALTVGDPSLPDTAIGALVSLPHRQKVLSYIALAQEEGGTISAGGAPPTNPALQAGAFLLPTVVEGLSPHSRCSTEEIFGPLVTVHPFDTEDEVVGYANCTRYGLAGSVWTTDVGRAHRVPARMHTGMVWVNCWLHRDLRVPFGGVKSSGVGHEGGTLSFEAYSHPKNVCIFNN